MVILLLLLLGGCSKIYYIDDCKSSMLNTPCTMQCKVKPDAVESYKSIVVVGLDGQYHCGALKQQ